MTLNEIKDIQDYNVELLTPLLEFEIELNKKGFGVNIKIVDGEIQVSLKHKWFLFPIILFRADIIDKIIKPLGFRLKRWFRRKTLSAPVYVIEKT